jgi:rubrerythrin
MDELDSREPENARETDELREDSPTKPSADVRRARSLGSVSALGSEGEEMPRVRALEAALAQQQQARVALEATLARERLQSAESAIDARRTQQQLQDLRQETGHREERRRETMQPAPNLPADNLGFAASSASPSASMEGSARERARRTFEQSTLMHCKKCPSHDGYTEPCRKPPLGSSADPKCSCGHM